jgi:hypothetical protein
MDVRFEIEMCCSVLDVQLARLALRGLVYVFESFLGAF